MPYELRSVDPQIPNELTGKREELTRPDGKRTRTIDFRLQM